MSGHKITEGLKAAIAGDVAFADVDVASARLRGFKSVFSSASTRELDSFRDGAMVEASAGPKSPPDIDALRKSVMERISKARAYLAR